MNGMLIKNVQLGEFDKMTTSARDIRILDGRILEVAPTLQKQEGEELLDGKGMLCIPAFCDLHNHLVQSLQKGRMDGLPITKWLVKMLTLEQNLTEEEYYYGTMMGLLEGLRFGVTTFHDMMQYPWLSAAAAAYTDAGLRVVFGLGASDVAENDKTYILPVDEAVKRAEEIHTKYHMKNGGLLRTDVAPLGLPACSKELMQGLKAFTKKNGLTFHTHLAEGRKETDDMRVRTGMGECEALYEYGILDEKTILAHSIWLSDHEVDLLAKSRATVVHCPFTNLKISDGVPKIDLMARRGVHLAMGCDGEASSSNRDMIREMRAGALLQKGVTGDPLSMPESLCYDMMTKNGAHALGFDDLGEIKPGNRADLLLVDMHDISLVGRHTMLSNFLYAGTGFQVDTVLTEGKIRLRGREFVDLDAEKIMAKCETIVEDVYGRLHF